MCHVWVIYQICFNVHPKLDGNDGGPIGTRFFFKFEALPALCSPRSMQQEVTLKICGLGMWICRFLFWLYFVGICRKVT